MNIFNFFRRPKVDEANLGLALDSRSFAAKEMDYRAEEIEIFMAIPWIEKAESTWKKFPIFDQDGSSSCVAQAMSKVLGIENHLEEGKFIHYSARDIYSRRKNKPALGMWLQDGMDICYRHGSTVEQLMPSQKEGEEFMNNGTDRKMIDVQIALAGKAGGYLHLPMDFDAIGAILDQGKAVMIGVRFGSGEWSRMVPEVTSAKKTYGHAIAVVDRTLYEGKKALIIEDSWGVNTGYGGRRIVTEDWIPYMIGAGYLKNLKNTWRDGSTEKPKPKHRFEVDLHYASSGDDIRALQNILKYEELFPQETASTGYYGSITAKSVMTWQLRHNVAPKEEIEGLQGRSAGPKTRAKLNEMYA